MEISFKDVHYELLDRMFYIMIGGAVAYISKSFLFVWLYCVLSITIVLGLFVFLMLIKSKRRCKNGRTNKRANHKRAKQ